MSNPTPERITSLAHLTSAVKWVTQAVDTRRHGTDSAYAPRSLLCWGNGEMVATDGYRLHREKMSPPAGAGTEPLLIEPKAIRSALTQLRKAWGGGSAANLRTVMGAVGEDGLTLGDGEKQVSVRFPPAVQSAFPDYGSAHPNPLNAECVGVATISPIFRSKLRSSLAGRVGLAGMAMLQVADSSDHLRTGKHGPLLVISQTLDNQTLVEVGGFLPNGYVEPIETLHDMVEVDWMVPRDNAVVVAFEMKYLAEMLADPVTPESGVEFWASKKWAPNDSGNRVAARPMVVKPTTSLLMPMWTPA